MARILGLDIGTSTVRAALIKTSLRRVDVMRYVTVPLATDVDRSSALREASAAIIATIGSAPDGVMAMIPGESASLRVVELPAGAARRIDEVLPYELENLVPFDVMDAVVDHQPIDTSATALRVLVAAAPKARVSQELTTLRDAGIDPTELAVGAAALDGLVPLVPGLDAQGPILIVDFGPNDTNVAILRSGRVEFIRTISLPARAMREPGVSMARAVHQTVSAYRAAGGAPLAAVYVSGDTATSVAPWLQTELGQQVELLPVPTAPGADPADSLGYARALALAGRAAARGKHLDLRRGEFAARRSMGLLRQHARALVVAGACVLLAFAFSTYAKWSVLDDRRDGLREELAKLTEEALGEKTGDVRRARDLLAGHRGTADPLPKFDAYHALAAISNAVPESVTHDVRRITIELGEEGRPGRFDLQGTLGTLAERDRLVEELRKQTCFRELETGRTNPAVGSDRLNYQIEAVIQCPGEGRTKNNNRPRSARNGS